jgi:hypothetical protein
LALARRGRRDDPGGESSRVVLVRIARRRERRRGQRLHRRENPIDLSHIDSASIVQSSGNILTGTTGSQQDTGGTAFTPPYAFTLDPASAVQALVSAGAGPQ